MALCNFGHFYIACFLMHSITFERAWLHARVFKFHVWIPHEKIADSCFFSHPDYAPFLSYGPSKKLNEILAAKYLQNYSR